MMTMQLPSEISIVGGGLSGLMLARILQQSGWNVVVHERDEFIYARSQGGVLDLHQESGIWAFKQAGIYEAIKKSFILNGQSMRVLNSQAECLWSDLGEREDAGRPEVDRPILKEALLDSLADKTVRWGSNITKAEPTTGGWRLFSESGEMFETPILVGADGSRSKLRRHVTEHAPFYCGVTAIEMRVSSGHKSYSKYRKLTGDGSMMALGSNKGIISHICGNGDIELYCFERLAEKDFWKQNKNFPAPSAVHSYVNNIFSEWAPSLREIALSYTGLPRVWPLYAMPLEATWNSKKNITLIGDAAHAMSPFAGEGANQALQDGACLATLFLQRSPAEAIEMYERDMHKRVLEPKIDSAKNLAAMISQDGAQAAADFFST